MLIGMMPMGIMTASAEELHTHTWTYSLGNTNLVNAFCSEHNPIFSDGTLEIIAPTDTFYTGERIEATVVNNLTTGNEVSDIVYTKDDEAA